MAFSYRSQRQLIMMRLALEQATDFRDFTNGNNLSDFLKQNSIKSVCCKDNVKRYLSHIRVSPDGKHIHVILNKPTSRLLTFDKYTKDAHVLYQKHPSMRSTRTVPVVDIVYLDHSKKESGFVILLVVFENGKAEFWKYWERKAGWNLLQTSDLCNSPKVKLISVCTTGKFIVWCEERPTLPNLCSLVANREHFRYSICGRTFVVKEGVVCLGGVRIELHNSPRYIVIASGDNVYLLPDLNGNTLRGVSKFFLMWSPQSDTITVSSPCAGALLRKDLPNTGEGCNFKGLILACSGLLSAIDPPEICAFSPAGCGGLMLLLSTGWISVMENSGVLRRVHKLADDLVARGANHVMCLRQDLLVVTIEKNLCLIDTECGLELERIPLKRWGVLIASCGERYDPYLLTEDGIFIIRCEPGFPHGLLGRPEDVSPDSVLAGAVFEEACKHYQRRSLSSTQLTTEKLMSGGMFQAPISLLSILGDYLKDQRIYETMRGGAGVYDKLLSSLESELKSLAALEEIKACVVRASEEDLVGYCETLVLEEVGRLLRSELEGEDIHYLNVIFETFPTESWRALQIVLLQRGEGSLSTKASPEVWRSVLNPIQPGASHLPQRTPANAAVPTFELFCRSVFRFQPGWLPWFLELAQEQARASSSSSSSWAYGATESTPLYKRALSILPANGESRDLEVELLLCSQRPDVVKQALRFLLSQRQWGRVAQAAERLCQQSPPLGKLTFSTLLCEVAQHRDLDPYLGLMWDLCPVDLTSIDILSVVLESLPAPSLQGTKPFQAQSGWLTVGLLKPLLSKVLWRETKLSQRYVDILQPPCVPSPSSLAAGSGVSEGHGEGSAVDHQHSSLPSLLS